MNKTKKQDILLNGSHEICLLINSKVNKNHVSGLRIIRIRKITGRFHTCEY